MFPRMIQGENSCSQWSLRNRPIFRKFPNQISTKHKKYDGKQYLVLDIKNKFEFIICFGEKEENGAI